METVLLTLVTLSLVLAGIFYFRRVENYAAVQVNRFRLPNDPKVEWDEKNYNEWVGNLS
tara:strand:- start:1262 stop:1438 length:177 start_codon:yes stop_codon:yes gene_type:complete